MRHIKASPPVSGLRTNSMSAQGQDLRYSGRQESVLKPPRSAFGNLPRTPELPTDRQPFRFDRKGTATKGIMPYVSFTGIHCVPVHFVSGFVSSHQSQSSRGRHFGAGIEADGVRCPTSAASSRDARQSSPGETAARRMDTAHGTAAFAVHTSRVLRCRKRPGRLVTSRTDHPPRSTDPETGPSTSQPVTPRAEVPIRQETPPLGALARSL